MFRRKPFKEMFFLQKYKLQNNIIIIMDISPFQPINEYFDKLNYPLPLKKCTLKTVYDINKPNKFSFKQAFEANLSALEELFQKILQTVMDSIERVVDKCSFIKSLEPARRDVEQSLTKKYGYNFSNLTFPQKSKQEIYDIIDDILILANAIKIKLLQIFQMPEPGNMNVAISKAIQKENKKNKHSNIANSDQQFLLEEKDLMCMKGVGNLFEQIIQEKQENQKQAITNEDIIDKAFNQQKFINNEKPIENQTENINSGKIKKFFAKICGKDEEKKEKPPSQIKQKISILSQKFKPIQQAHRSTLLAILNNVQGRMPLNITQLSFIKNMRFSKSYKISKFNANIWIQAIEKISQLQQNKLYFSNSYQIQQLLKRASQIKIQKQAPQDINQQYNEHTIIIGQSFIVFEQKYDPVRRRFLKSMIKYILQRNLSKINLFSVLRNVENDHLRKVPDSPLLDALRQKKVNQQQVSKIIKQQLQIINKQTISQPLEQSFDILRFSKSGQNNKIINLIISGFLSQDVDKQAQYADLVKMMNESQIYGIRWASKGVNNMFQWMFSVGQNIVKKSPQKEQTGGPHVRAANLLARFKNSIDDNPFKYAFQVAIITGYYLAEFLIRNFQGYQINIVTYSLGAQLVKCILRRLNEAKRLFIINQVVILGGVTDVDQFSNLLKIADYPIKIINLYSKNDSVLRYLLRQSKPQIRPVGLNEIKNSSNQKFKHVIINQDCSKFIWSHLIYRSRLTIIGNMIDARTD